MIIRLVLLVVLLSPIACAHKYKLPLADDAERVIPVGSGVYVAQSADGQDDRPRTYKDSGKWTRDAKGCKRG